MNFFGVDKILRLTPINEKTIDIADDIENKIVHIFPSLSPIKIEEGLHELYEMRFPSTESTYALYTYALYPLSYLVNAYELTSRKEYLLLGMDFLTSFLEWEEADKNISAKRLAILFGDHAISNRTQAICYLIVALNKEGIKIPEQFVKFLLKNGDYLSDINNYSNYNHGLMMDLSLLGLIRVLSGLSISFPEKFKINLLERLNYSLTRDLTNDGVHIENSPGYHFWILNFLQKITTPLKELDELLYEKSQEYLFSAQEYALYLTRLDGSVPSIGDSHQGLKYTPKNGLSSHFFSNSNTVIFRYDHDQTWAFFSSGYKTQVHKHQDNGGINIFYKGEDLLIDPGFLNYESTDESSYFRKVWSHNTVSPFNKEQDIKSIDIQEIIEYSENLSGSRIVNFNNINNFEYSVAIIDEYGDFPIARLVGFLEEETICIFDMYLNPNGRGLTQTYNFSKLYKVLELGKTEFLLESQKNKNIKLNIFSEGDINTFIKDEYKVKSFNSKENITRLQVDTDSDSALVIISPSQELFIIEDMKMKYIQTDTVINFEQLIFDALDFEKRMNSLVEKEANLEILTSFHGKITLENNKFILEMPDIKGRSYAFYLEHKGEIEKHFYTKNYRCISNLNVKNGIYTATFYTQDQKNGRKHNKIRFIFNEDNGLSEYVGKVLAETDSYKLTYYDMGSETTFVVFNGTGTYKDSDAFGLDYLLPLGVNVIVCAQNNDQYQGLSFDEFKRIVDPIVRNKKVFLYGSSLGGYCAIYYAGAVNGTVISASPRNSAHPNIKAFFPKKYIDMNYYHENIEDNHLSDKNIYILRDDAIEEDNYYIDGIIKKAYPNLICLNYKNAGHEVLYHVNRVGQLTPIIKSIINYKNPLQLINEKQSSEFTIFNKILQNYREMYKGFQDLKNIEECHPMVKRKLVELKDRIKNI